MNGKIIISFLLVSILASTYCEDDLYKVLGVKKSASAKEIKKAYKNLAKEWHPDKNRDPSANEIFMKINEAYETLGDAEKRSNYDRFGHTAGDMGHQGRGGHPGGGGFHPFDSFFTGGGGGNFHFNFGGGGGRGGGEANLEKFRITNRILETKVMPDSARTPYLMYGYAEFCFQCMQVEGIWERVRGDLESVGVGVGTVHVHIDQAVARKLRLWSVPGFVAVINGKAVHYNGRTYSVQGLRDFVRNLIPRDTVTELTDSTYESFLNGWKDNRVRMIFCDDRMVLPMRFLFAAYANKERILAGYIQTNRPGTEKFRKKFGVKQYGETFLMFNENTETPLAQINMKTVSRSTMDEVIDNNQYLGLPRLSSQRLLNTLCPAESSIRKKMLCVVLLARNTPSHEDYVRTFREYAASHHDPEERVRYAYVWEDTQAKFVSTLTRGEGIGNSTRNTLKVAVIWRREPSKLNYDWLEDGWPSSGAPAELQRSRRQLHRLVDWARQSKDILPHVMLMQNDLLDEHVQALLSRMMGKIHDWYEYIWDKIVHIDEIAVITLVATVTFMVIIGYMMKTLVTIEDGRVRDQYTRQQPRGAAENDNDEQPTVSVHPLCTQNFEQLLIRTEPGMRTIVLLVDEQSRHKLLQHFVTVLHPYSRLNAFVFAFLQLEQYLPWYRRLLEYTVDDQRDFSAINIRNCIGTVLVINGPRKYYCIYHAYAEKLRRIHDKQKKKSTAQFMGFTDDSDSDDRDDISPPEGDAEKFFHSDLLAGFGMWMERVMEGSVKRYRVDVWPNMALLS